MDGGGALGESCDLCSKGVGLGDEDAFLTDVEGTGADDARLEVYDLVAATDTLKEPGSRTPFREAAARLEEAALESIMTES